MTEKHHGSDSFPRRALKVALKQTLVFALFIAAFVLIVSLVAERYFPDQQGYVGMISLVLAYLAWRPIADDISRANRTPTFQ